MMHNGRENNDGAGGARSINNSVIDSELKIASLVGVRTTELNSDTELSMRDFAGVEIHLPFEEIPYHVTGELDRLHETADVEPVALGIALAAEHHDFIADPPGLLVGFKENDR